MRDYRPLTEISVVDLSGGVAGRYCARLLAQLGAVVIGPAAEDGHGLGYGSAAGEAFGRWLDGGKRLAPRAEAEAAAAALSGPLAMAITDGDGPAHGAGPDTPLVLDISAFGPEGPYAAWRTSAPLLQAMAGSAFYFGAAGEPPLLAQGHEVEVITGATAFIGGVAALFGRLRGHSTARAEVSAFESALCFAEVSAIDPGGRGRAVSRAGVNRWVPTYPSGIYRSADGWIGVTALTPVQWATLCDLIGRPEMAKDPRVARPLAGAAEADLVDAMLAEAMPARTTDEWVELGIRLRLPLSPVIDQRAIMDAPMWRGRDSFAALEGEPLQGPALPFHVTAQDQVRSPPPPLPADPAGPLAGVRVVDFTMGWAGPLATRHLGDLGAEVIKIEAVDYPDWWRGWERDETSDPPSSEVKLPFMAVNRNKRGIVLDLRSPEGLARARRLIAGADVVVDNFAPGTLDKLGLDMAHRRSLRPGLINLAMSAFGASGPWSGIRGYGSTVEQASGLPFANGHGHWPPAMQHPAYGDPIAGLYGTVAVLAALHGRERLGGVDLDLSQVECLFQLGADAFVAVQVNGEPVPRRGSRRACFAPCGAFPTSGDDMWVAIAVADAVAWRALCRLIGREDWADDPALADVAIRDARADAIEAAVARWTTGRTRAEAVDLLQAVGVPAAPVLRGGELLDDPHLAARGFWQEVDRRYIGRHSQAAPPYRLDGRRPPIRRVPPVLGEHTDEVLIEFGVLEHAA